MGKLRFLKKRIKRVLRDTKTLKGCTIQTRTLECVLRWIEELEETKK